IPRWRSSLSLAAAKNALRNLCGPREPRSTRLVPDVVRAPLIVERRIATRFCVDDDFLTRTVATFDRQREYHPVAERDGPRQTIEHEAIAAPFEPDHLAGWKWQACRVTGAILRHRDADLGGDVAAGCDERSPFGAGEIHVGGG